MADYKRVILLRSLKPSQFFVNEEKELEVVLIKSNHKQLEEDIFSSTERTLYTDYEEESFNELGFRIKKIENYKHDLYDVVYLLDGRELYKVYVY